MSALGTLVVNLRANAAQFLAGIKAAQSAVATFAGKSAQSLKKFATEFAALGAAYVSFRGFKSLVGKTIEFSDAMLSAQAVTARGATSFEQLEATARHLGETTSFTASEVALLMVELGRAGFNTDQVDAMTASVLNLSRATGTDAAQSAGIMSATIRQFGLGATDAARVADVLATAAASSFTTLETLGESLSYAGTTAADLGLTLEETTALVAALGNLGIQGSQAGTALRRLGVVGAAHLKQLESIFQTSLHTTSGEALPLIQMLQRMDEATQSLTKTERVKRFAEAFGLLGVTAASALSKGAAGVGELLDTINKGQDKASLMAQMMDSELGGSMRRLQSAAEALALSVGDTLAPSMERIANLIAWMLPFFTRWAPAIVIVSTVLLGLAAALGAVTLAQMAYAKAAAIAMAFGGPKGWLMLAAGAAAAVGAIVAVDMALGNVAEDMEKVNTAAAQAAGANTAQATGAGTTAAAGGPAANAAAGASRAKQAIEAMKQRTEDLLSIMDGLKTPWVKMNEEVARFNMLLRTTPLGQELLPIADQLVAKFIEMKSGFTDAVKDVSREIMTLSGTITDRQFQVMDFRQMGVSEEALAMFQRLNKEKDKLTARKTGGDFLSNLVDDLAETTGLMTKNEQTMRDLAKQGVPPDQLAAIQELLDLQESLTKQKSANTSGGFAGVAERGSAEALKTIFSSQRRNEAVTIAKQQQKTLLDILKSIRERPQSSGTELSLQGSV